jgi:hypothetical protein
VNAQKIATWRWRSQVRTEGMSKIARRPLPNPSPLVHIFTHNVADGVLMPQTRTGGGRIVARGTTHRGPEDPGYEHEARFSGLK